MVKSSTLNPRLSRFEKFNSAQDPRINYNFSPRGLIRRDFENLGAETTWFHLISPRRGHTLLPASGGGGGGGGGGEGKI